MKIKVEVNGLVYDSSNPKCKCILSNSQRKLYAFLLVLDGDMTWPDLPASEDTPF